MITELRHPVTGATAKIHEHGATVLSYVTSQGRELLFVSQKALLDGSKAIRGGIPLVFPIFGPPPPKPAGEQQSTMPQHGFARNNKWTLVHKHPDSTPVDGSIGSVSATFRLDLKDVVNGRGTNNPWENDDTYNVRLEMTVSIHDNDQLVTELVVNNTGIAAFDFQALFHTYYRVPNRAALNPKLTCVTGLGAYEAFDQLTSQTKVLGSDDAITIASEVDAIHTPPESKRTAHVTVVAGGDEASGTKYVVETTCEATITSGPQADSTTQRVPTQVPVSVVVWNPYVEKAASMADFGDDEYHDMICVEPGILHRPVVLEPGHVATLRQFLQPKVVKD